MGRLEAEWKGLIESEIKEFIPPELRESYRVIFLDGRAILLQGGQ